MHGLAFPLPSGTLGWVIIGVLAWCAVTLLAVAAWCAMVEYYDRHPGQLMRLAQRDVYGSEFPRRWR